MSEELAKSEKKYKIKLIPERCKTCDLCINLCPKKCLKMQDGTIIQIGECSGCKLCERYCPDFAIWVIEAIEATTKDTTSKT